MGIQIDERGAVRAIIDDMNPRIYNRQFKCYGCGEWVDEDDSVWIDPITREATMLGEPYHVSCAPPELEEKEKIINKVLEQIKEDINQNKDLTPLEELLKVIPIENLEAYLPEEGENHG